MKNSPLHKRPVLAAFHVRLTELRLRAGWTMAQLAERAGTSAGAICHLEAGIRSPSMLLAGRLAVALGVSVDSLYYPPGAPVLPLPDDFEMFLLTRCPPGDKNE